jgi:hypothetical protein
MAHGPKTPETIRDCKIKPVYPAFRSVSTPRGRKDLRVVGLLNPETALGTAESCAPASEWRAEDLAERLRSELSPRAWNRLVRASEDRGASIEQLFWSGLSELV